MRVVVWTGPVNLTQVPGATIEGAETLNIGCLGDRSPHCPSIANGYLDAEGRRLPQLLADHGLSVGAVDEVLYGAFSAGGSLVKRALMNAADREKTRVVHLADATYTSSWEDEAARRPPPIEGFVRYGLDAIDGDQLLVATASPIPNKTWASGVENLDRLKDELEARSGRSFEPLDDFFGIEPAPERAYRLGNVILAMYPLEPLGHGHTQIAPQVWEKIIRPWLRGQPVETEPGPTAPPPAEPLAKPSSWWLALGAAAGLAGGYLLGRRRS
jgi:hypothetical protein